LLLGGLHASTAVAGLLVCKQGDNSSLHE